MESVSETIFHARLPRSNTQLRTPHGEGAVAYSVWSRLSSLETMSGQSAIPTLRSTCSFQTCQLRREGDKVRRVMPVSQCARLQRGEKGDQHCYCPLRIDSVGSGVPAQIWCQMCEGHSKAVQWVDTILPHDLAVISRALRSDGKQLLPGRTGHTELSNPIIRSLLALSSSLCAPMMSRPSLDGAEKQVAATVRSRHESVRTCTCQPRSDPSEPRRDDAGQESRAAPATCVVASTMAHAIRPGSPSWL